MSGSSDELRALIREVIRDQLGPVAAAATESAETVSLSTDADLAAFVTRLLGLDDAQRQAIRDGRKRFRLAAPSMPMAPSIPLERADGANGTAAVAPVRRIDQAPAAPARRIERGAVTERVVRDAARNGERLVLGPGAVLTPLARDRARSSGVRIEKER